MEYHYIYKLTALNPVDSREFYIGVRSCKCDPEDDPYMSSSKEVAKAIQSGVQFSKRIMATCETREDAVAMEIAYHNYYDVAANPKFFNLAKQTSTGFDVTGMTMPESHRQAGSKRMSGKNNIKCRPDQRQLMRTNNPMFSLETKEKVKLALRGNANPAKKEAVKEKMKAAKLGNGSDYLRGKNSVAHRDDIKIRKSAAMKELRAYVRAYVSLSGYTGSTRAIVMHEAKKWVLDNHPNIKVINDY